MTMLMETESYAHMYYLAHSRHSKKSSQDALMKDGRHKISLSSQRLGDKGRRLGNSGSALVMCPELEASLCYMKLGHKQKIK